MVMDGEAERLGQALEYAARWHHGHTRKASGAPYISHLVHVAGFVLEHGGGTDEAIAALLHDAIEDTAATLDDIRSSFGEEVARIVADATDTLPGDRPDRKSPWAIRKRRHLERMAAMATDSALVVACDKRHNLDALVAGIRADGLSATAERFSSDPDQWLWYYGEAIGLLRARIPSTLAGELDGLMAELRRLVPEP